MKRLYQNGDKFYVIIREIPLHNLMRKDGSVIAELFNGWKEHLMANHVLKNSTHFLFCQAVDDISFTEVFE
jgi:hypothetical protein